MSKLQFYTSLKLNDFFRQSLNTQMETILDLCQIVHSFLEVQELEGDIVEFGCFQGHVSKILQLISPDKSVHVYDSFEGLPIRSEVDNNTAFAGMMSTSVESLIENFSNDKIPLPQIHQSWFEDLLQDDIPEKISFAYLDGDLYESIKCSLNLIYDNVIKQGIIMIDDYGNEWKGVKIAVDEFFSNKPETVKIMAGTYKAVVVKQ